MIQATMEDDPNHASPGNWGDPLITYQFGMSYGKDPEFKYSCLIVPTVQVTTEVESGSSTTTQTTISNRAKAGEPFTVYALLRNNGADGITTAQLKANGEVAAEEDHDRRRRQLARCPDGNHPGCRRVHHRTRRTDCEPRNRIIQVKQAERKGKPFRSFGRRQSRRPPRK